MMYVIFIEFTFFYSFFKFIFCYKVILYTFFFSSVIGKQLSKAVFTTAIISAVVLLLGEFGYTVICVSSAALAGYIPLAVVLLLLWFLIGHLL